MKISLSIHRLLNNWPAKILSLAAAVLLVVFNNVSRLEERYFSVPLQLVLPADFVPAAPYTQRVRVTLRGDGDDVFRILEDDVRAFADLSDYGNDGVYRVPVQVEKRGSALDVEPLEIRVDPIEISVTLEQRERRSVEVLPSLSGFPPPGYQLGQYQLSPSTVEVQGPRSIVEEVYSIETEDIELAGRNSDFSVRVRLIQPDPLVQIIGGDVVEFRGVIEESVVLHTFEPVETVLLGLAEGLTIVSSLPSGSVRVQGRQFDLDEIQPNDVQLIVDASAISVPGSYQLAVRPDVPRGLLVLRYEPSQIEVEVVQQQ
ncbi:MAG: hypothetical protein EA404_13635 [Spirochaetaceae bacterium]|nr:MAG: hypothetical protein EA404_13635 [Spirochaetaceae bacterium]